MLTIYQSGVIYKMADQIIRRIKLNTIAEVKAEIVKLYRSSRNDGLETQDLTRYVSVLHILVNIMRDSDLEARIEALESVK